MILEECTELSRKWQISEKLFWALHIAKSVKIQVPDFLWHWSSDSEIIELFYFGTCFSKFDMILEEWAELSRKWYISKKSFYDLDNAKIV